MACSMTIFHLSSIVLYVHGKNVITDITLNDGEWHFICATWTSTNGKYDIFIDGNLRDSGYNLSTNSVIEANGTIVVGQEQVSVLAVIDFYAPYTELSSF